MPSASRQLASPLLVALCGIFFLSGASALTYQILWLRALGLVFGVTVYAASTVWAGFMAGLAIGSLVAGRLADRVKRPLLWFAAVEAGIAVTAALATLALAGLEHWYPRLAPALGGGLMHATALRFAITFFLLILPTGLMGSTLPFVVKSATQTGNAAAIGALYGSNTAGAIVGAIAAGLWLIPVFGMHVALMVACSLNGAAMLLAAFLFRVRPNDGIEVRSGEAAARPTALQLSSAARATVLATFTVSGGVALALEVVWLRSATILLGPTVYTVALLLATILAGIAAGSYSITPFLRRIEQPLAALALLESLTATSILLSLATLTATPVIVDLVPVSLRALLPMSLVTIEAGAALVALPTSLLMGLAFPLGLYAWTESSGDADRRSSRLGLFYAMNVCAGVMGSLGAGFLLLPKLGSRGTILVLAAVTLTTAIGLAAVSARSWIVRVAVPLAMIAAFVVTAGRIADPIASLLALRVPGQPVIWHEEGVQTTASIHMFLGGRRQELYLDGYHQSTNVGATLGLHYKIGTLPVALHANPHSALVVGLGGGATAGAMSRHTSLDVDVVELSDTVVRASEFFRPVNFDLLSRPNVHLRIGDGRNYLLAERRRHYDIITADTIQPVRAGAASLYSREYFTLVRDRLNDDGVALQWFEGTDAEYSLVARTFLDVFPYATVWEHGALLVGTKMPLKISPEMFNWKLAVPGLSDALATIGIRSFDDLLRVYWGGPSDIRRHVGQGAILTDDRPILEYFLAMRRDKQMNPSDMRGDVRQIIGE